MEHNTLRPQTLEDYIGQNRVKKLLRVSIASCRARGEVLPHIVLHGPPGLGKTSLAAIIAHEMNGVLEATNASAIQTYEDLLDLITKVDALVRDHGSAFLFIDEIHRIPMQVEEMLYEVMEDFIFTLKGYGQTLVRKFTLIGATTLLGNLSRPLRDRFGLQFRLEPYTEKDIGRIITRRAYRTGINISYKAIVDIARRSRGVARVACNYLDRCRDMAIYMGKEKVDKEVTRATFDLMGIDEMGLSNQDYAYLEILARDDRPKGINTIAAAMNESAVSISEAIEPYLTQIGLVERTPRGRILTSLGRQLLETRREG